MTVITRVANRYFARRPAPGRTRVWLRSKSAVWGHFDPLGAVVARCRCGHDTELGRSPRITGTFVEILTDKHNIGFVTIAGIRHDKFCNGEEVAP